MALFVLDLVRELDLSAIEATLQAKDARGERSYSPLMMTTLLTYAYATGVFSSRRIERAIVEDVAFRFLAGGEHPHFTTINQFRALHRKALADLFSQVLGACQSAGLVTLEHVAIDGTKMKANASKHKAMSYERMRKDETRVRAEVEEWLARAEAVDAEEDERDGKPDPAEEIRRREERLAKMTAAREALRRETEAARAAKLREQAEALRQKASEPTTSAQKQAEFTTLAAKRDQQADQLVAKCAPQPDRCEDDRDPPAPGPDDDLPRNTPPATRSGEPKPTAQRNFTDPESRIMVRDGAYIQAYNAQIAVDEKHQIIVAAAVSNQAPDSEYFRPMLRRVVENCDAVPERVTGDSGYFSADNVRFAEHMGSLPFISVGKHRNDGALSADMGARQHQTVARLEMRARLESPEGHAAYARRKATVEPVFGQVRACRGFRQFSFRGLFKNRCEWQFVCLTHNLLKLFRAQLQPLRNAPAAA